MQTIIKPFKHFKREKRGVSNVIVVMLSLVLMIIVVSNVVLWSYQMNQIDWERGNEKIEIANVSFAPSGETRISVKNIGSVSVHIVALWISNSTSHQRMNVNIYIDLGQTVTYALVFPFRINELYVVKAITERGNLAEYTLKLDYSDHAMIVYGEGSISIPRYRTWNGVSWSAEENGVATSSSIEWTVLTSCPSRNEKILGVLSSAGYLDASVWNGDDQTWGVSLRIASVGTTIDNYRLFDITYEQNSGNAIIMYNPSSVGIDPQFMVWNGSSWSTPQTVDIATTGIIYWIKLTSNPKNNEIAMITLDANQDVYGMIWNGTNWANGQLLEDVASTNLRECIAVEYMYSSERAMFVWGSGTLMYSRIWNGTVWENELAGINIGATCYWFSLKADPNSDGLVLVSVDSDSDLNTARWNETQWILDAEHDDSLETSVGRCADAEFETTPGHEGHISLVWGDLNTDQITYKHFNGTTWSSLVQISLSVFPTTDQRWHVLRRDMTGRIFLSCVDDGNDINTGYWNGTDWTWTDEAESAAATVSMQCFDLSPNVNLENVD